MSHKLVNAVGNIPDLRQRRMTRLDSYGRSNPLCVIIIKSIVAEGLMPESTVRKISACIRSYETLDQKDFIHRSAARMLVGWNDNARGVMALRDRLLPRRQMVLMRALALVMIRAKRTDENGRVRGVG